METLRDRKDLPEQIRRAIDELEELKKDPNMRYEAINKDMYIRDYFQGMNDAKKEGEMQGKIEGNIEIAKKLLNKGYSTEDIAELTGLSFDEISGFNI